MAFKMKAGSEGPMKKNFSSAFQTGDKKGGKMWTKKQLEKMGKNIKDYKKRGWMGNEDLYQHKDSLSTKHKDTGFDTITKTKSDSSKSKYWK